MADNVSSTSKTYTISSTKVLEDMMMRLQPYDRDLEQVRLYFLHISEHTYVVNHPIISKTVAELCSYLSLLQKNIEDITTQQTPVSTPTPEVNYTPDLYSLTTPMITILQNVYNLLGGMESFLVHQLAVDKASHQITAVFAVRRAREYAHNSLCMLYAVQGFSYQTSISLSH
jgi:hypothetical protein